MTVSFYLLFLCFYHFLSIYFWLKILVFHISPSLYFPTMHTCNYRSIRILRWCQASCSRKPIFLSLSFCHSVFLSVAASFFWMIFPLWWRHAFPSRSRSLVLSPPPPSFIQLLFSWMSTEAIPWPHHWLSCRAPPPPPKPERWGDDDNDGGADEDGLGGGRDGAAAKKNGAVAML